MIRLAKPIVKLIVEEYGTQEFLKRVADPYWFQALGCALGYDWHSSGVTTVLTAVLKAAINSQNIGIAVCGGKGKYSLNTLDEIEREGLKLGISTRRVGELKLLSRLIAKVDNAALQDGYVLYHHAFIFDEYGKWVVVQQGMNPLIKYARRYHWFSLEFEKLLNDPHSGIITSRREKYVLNLASKESQEARRTVLDLAKENPIKIRRLFKQTYGVLKRKELKNLDITHFTSGTDRPAEMPVLEKYTYLKELYMPRDIDWSVLKRVYDYDPRDFRELLMIKGIGARTLRALSLIAELIYGTPVSWRDPAKFSFAFGGKDGVPFPVDVKAMDEAFRFMENIVNALKIEKRRKREILRRLLIIKE